jgi:hypothetical protein
MYKTQPGLDPNGLKMTRPNPIYNPTFTIFSRIFHFYQTKLFIEMTDAESYMNATMIIDGPLFSQHSLLNTNKYNTKNFLTKKTQRERENERESEHYYRKSFF